MSKHQKELEESDWKKVAPCLYRYKGGTYYGLLKVGGKQKRRSLDTNDFAKAKRELATWKKDIELTDPKISTRTIETNAEGFMAALTGAPSTQSHTRRTIKRFLKTWKGPRAISKIKKSDCEAWLANFQDFRPSTINKMIQDLRSFFSRAVDDGVIARSPMEKITYRKRGEISRITPTAEHFDAIVADIRSQASNGHGADNSADFVALAGTLGLGQAELSAIQRQHIDLDAGTIQVFRKKTQKGFVIPIYPNARPIIERRLAAMPSAPTERLLPQDNCKKGLAASCKRLGFSNFEPRSLRRLFITTALRTGIDVATIAAWQGHRDGGALILKVYGDEVRLDHSLRMAARLGPTPENVIPMKEVA